MMNNAAIRQTMENVKKLATKEQKKHVTKERTRKYLVSELNYHTTKIFTRHVLAIEMRKTQIHMNKPAYLGLSILDLSKTDTLQFYLEFWCDYVKLKYGENAKLLFKGTDSFIVHVKTDDIYKDTPEHVKTRFDISHFETERPLPKGKKM